MCSGITIKTRAAVVSSGMVDAREIATALNRRANANQHAVEGR